MKDREDVWTMIPLPLSSFAIMHDEGEISEMGMRRWEVVVATAARSCQRKRLGREGQTRMRRLR